MTAESWRVAQLVVDRGPGAEGSRGSGYLVGPGLVLTAAHVVAGARVVKVRLDVGQPAEVDVLAAGWWADPVGHHGTDLAVVMIAPDATAGREVEPARFGRISEGMAVLAVQAFGFPRFKLRGDAADGGLGVFRDLEQVTGHAPVAANRRQGTLAVYLDDPAPATPEPGGSSPWAGMSGAAVWAAGRIVAVVAEHHLGEGTGRLTARRIDRAYDQMPERDLGQLVTRLGLPAFAGGLSDVVPIGPSDFVLSAYLEQVRDTAPDALIGREGELAEWAEFCAGPDPYAWWQAGPWAGKTALASWFVTHPPAGADVVSFFITGRLAGQADSDAFLDTMIGQLHVLGPAGENLPVVARARVGVWLSLLASAAAQAGERGRRLVVVVDGLDEDNAGAAPLRERPSIASLLPRRPPPGVRVIVTSRPDPGLPDDVEDGHPLRTCTPRRLPVSQVAEDLARRAQQELRDLLAGEQTGIDVVGAIAASGGGLTRSDLSALTGTPPRKLDPILRGVSGRSLETRAPTDSRDASTDPALRVYLFAHETLRTTAEEQLGDELARYLEGIHDWIGSYAACGWPDSTPGYAVRGYPGLLTTTSDTTRLSALARDPRRHQFLSRATGSDYAALAEIRTAQQLLAGQDVPDLQALVELAVYRHAISIRNRTIQVGLPAVWGRLGRFAHAEALAWTITSPADQAWALAELARAAAQAGDPDRASRLAADAEALARTIANPYWQARALAELARAAAQAGDPDRAEALARTITDPYWQARALAELARAAAQAGDPDRAEALARTITDPYWQARALAELARAAAQAGDPDRASRLAADAEAGARAITDPYWQARALTELARAAAQAGDPDRASRLAADAEAAARPITDPNARTRALTELARAAAQAGDPDHAEALARTITKRGAQARALAELARAAAQAGDPDRAEALARTIINPYAQARALTELARAAAQAGDPDRASRLAADAEAAARTITDPYWQARALTELARAAAQAGDPDRASRLAADAEAAARTITDPYWQARALAELARAAAQAGDPDHAEALARTITKRGAQARALAELARAAAQAGDPDRAEALARTITKRGAQARALAELARAAAQAGDPDRASRLAADAEALARTITNPYAQARALTKLARAAAQAGDPDHAEALARTITNPYAQARALTELARAAAQAGDPDHAEALARTITKRGAQARALTELARAAAQAGDPDHAEALARTITNPYAQARALTELARAAAQAGDPDHAEALARTITKRGAQARALTELARAAAQASDPDRARHLLALALTADSPEIRWWIKGVSHLFPWAIRGAGDVFVSAFTPGV